MLLAVNAVFIVNKSSAFSPEAHQNHGGPEELSFKDGTLAPSAIATSGGEDQYSSMGGEIFLMAETGAAVGITHTFSTVIPTRNGLKTYKVRKGDTLSGIATQFGISVNSIKLANPKIRGNIISPGDELIILPVSGFLYEIQKGDTIASVAAKHKTDVELIKQYNQNYQELFETPHAAVVLPYASPLNSRAYAKQYSVNWPRLPEGYLTRPVNGWNWGELHYRNAIDFGASCGTIIIASAEGIVKESSDDNFWNSGYGNYIAIEHPNGVKTLYAHTLKNKIERGDYVLQGEEIALVGNSGNTHGPTGCHLHFEVHNAKNPFEK